MRRRSLSSRPVAVEVRFENTSDGDYDVRADACIRGKRTRRCASGVGSTPTAAMEDALRGLADELAGMGNSRAVRMRRY